MRKLFFGMLLVVMTLVMTACDVEGKENEYYIKCIFDGSEEIYLVDNYTFKYGARGWLRRELIFDYTAGVPCKLMI